jgi:beta-lactamase superfamily II metal-dependent hydrolase
MAVENTEKNLITRMRKDIAKHPPARASVANTTTVAAPIKPLVAIYHLDTSGGDATIIVGPKKHVFVDTGFGASPGRMVGLAKMLCPSGPEYIAISHFDRDHFYGLGDIWSTFRKARIVTPATPNDLRLAAHTSSCTRCGMPSGFTSGDGDMIGTMQRMFEINLNTQVKRMARDDEDEDEPATKGNVRRACSAGTCMKPRQQGVDPVFLRRSPGAPIDLGDGVTMTSLATGVGAMNLSALRKNNESSLAWVLSAGGIRYYTAGDLEENEADVDAHDFHIVKCGHHGSHKATSATFLTKSRAKVAIIQGAHYGYNHPHADVLQRLKDNDVDTYATGIEISYGTRDVSHVVAAGDEVDHAGDIVVIIWENAYFSVCYMENKAIAVKTYKNRTLLKEAQAAPFADAIQRSLDLDTYTDFSEAMNAGLKDKKAGLPSPKPSFDAYKEPATGGARKTWRKVVRCMAAAGCGAPDVKGCSVCVAKYCQTHWDEYPCDERRCGRPTWPARADDPIEIEIEGGTEIGMEVVADGDGASKHEAKKQRTGPQTK